MDQTPEPAPQRDSLAAKLDALFRSRRAAGGEYTYEEVATGIAARGGPTISASYLYLLRRGVRDNPTKRHLEALAAFFGVPVSHFFDPRPAPAPPPGVDPALVDALRDPHVTELVRLARTLPPQTLDALTHLASRARPGTPPAATAIRPRDPASPATKVAADVSFAQVALDNGEPLSARDRLHSLLDGELDAPSRHEAMRLLAQAHHRLDDNEAAIRVQESLFEQCLAGASGQSLPMVAYTLSYYYISRDDFPAAIRTGELGVRASLAAGLDGTDDYLKLRATLLYAYHQHGEDRLAWSLAGQVVAEARAAGSTVGEGAARWNAAVVAETLGDLAVARQLAEEAMALFAENGDVVNFARLQVLTSWFLMSTDPSRPAEAAALLDRCHSQLVSGGSQTDLAQWETLRAMAHLLGGQRPEAEALARRAVLHLQDTTEYDALAHALIILGDVELAQGRRQQAQASYRSALGIPTDDEPPRTVARRARSVAERLALVGSSEEALATMRTILDQLNIPWSTHAVRAALDLAGTSPVVSPSQRMVASEGSALHH